MPIIMGTAGHIDHGKTTLIKALTGIDCDRLEEEKRRGITIELGFAFLDLGTGPEQRLSIVDVPGHERFVKNMVAGASGIDFVLLVIAADEGVMPQTREHLEICSLLGIRTGLVALTKLDMVEEEWLEMVQEDVAGFLQGTFLEGVPIVPVSAVKGTGLETLKQEIKKLAEELKPQRRTDLFRLPVDRIFTMKGYGTVITGTMISGSIGLGEEITVYPQGLTTKVRGLQSHGETVELAPAGRRTAVNLQGLDLQELERGNVLARPHSLFPHTVWDLQITCLSSAPRALKHRTEIHFHHGSREALARLYFLDRDKLAPGESAVCQARFNEPLVGAYGDRVVVRAFSPLRTVAGGVLLNPLGRKVKRFSPTVQDIAELATRTADDLVLGQLQLSGIEGCSFAQLRILTNLETKVLEKSLQTLSTKQLAFCFDREERVYVSGQTAQQLTASALEHVLAHHRKEPMKLGLSRSALASSWGRSLPPKLLHFTLERLLKQGDLVSDQDVLRHKEHSVSLKADQETLREQLVQAYMRGGCTPPNLKDVLEELGLSAKEAQPMLGFLQERNVLVKVKEDMLFTTQALDEVRGKVVDFLQQHEEMGPQEFREITGLSRKFAIPLLEHLDKEKLTVRVGDKRRLRKR